MEIESNNIREETSILLVNNTWDVRTIQADAVQGVLTGEEVFKFSFIEYFAMGGEAKTRYVANVVMPKSQLRSIGELFLKIADAESEEEMDIAATSEGVGAGGGSAEAVEGGEG